jgi:hypothetical protein
VERDAFDIVDWDGPTDRPYVCDGREIVPATEEVLREVAASAMLLSQGAARAEELLRNDE